MKMQGSVLVSLSFLCSLNSQTTEIGGQCCQRRVVSTPPEYQGTYDFIRVFDGEKEQSYVLLLDAKTFEEINIAYLPYNVPFSFHGNWFPELH